MPHTNPTRRRRIWERQGGKCGECSKDLEWYHKSPRPPWDVHHVLPRSMGGTDALENLLVLCVECHRRVHRGGGDRVVIPPRSHNVKRIMSQEDKKAWKDRVTSAWKKRWADPGRF